MKELLDTVQVLDLMYNGFSRESAARAVAESHGYPEWESPYMTALLADPLVQAFPEEFSYAPTHMSRHDGSEVMRVGAETGLFIVMNECADIWTDDEADWKPLDTVAFAE
jgi:hypothetical protein